jgi:hypothetical protein
MDIEYDPAKDAINRENHKVSLELAQSLEWDALWVMEDCRKDYGEPRFIDYAPIGRRVYCVVFTMRGGVYRIISLRKANRREVKYYASQI